MTSAGRTEAQQVETLVRRWADAVHTGDLDSVVENHADDIVMFDVPPADGGVRGLAAYRNVWPPFFGWQQQGAAFEITELEALAGNDVAFVWALLRCGMPEDLAKDPTNRLRLTIGLCKQDGRWLVTHEHQSFPNRD
jgi:uncharacterized protein (TIGR02246 family)